MTAGRPDDPSQGPGKIDASNPSDQNRPTAESSSESPSASSSHDGSNLESALSASRGARRARLVDRLQPFLSARTVRDALAALYGEVPALPVAEVARELNRHVGLLDAQINEQLNVILHHPAFQALEAGWRGLKHLYDCAQEESDSRILIRVLNANRRELERDFERATEFDQSQVFQKVYENEFGMPGGIPFGVVIADFAVRPFTTPEYPHDDLSFLRSMSRVAAAAFCPTIAGVHPSMFGLDQFSDMDYRVKHAETFEHLDYLKWRTLRDSEDARFLGLALPRVLMRAPYQDDGTRVDGFVFHEDVTGPDRSKFLWGNAAYALGGVLIRTFAEAGWLADIRGVRRDEESGGIVTGLAQYDFSTDAAGLEPRGATEVHVSDELERQLSDLGFISLCHCPDTPYSAFYSTPSLQKPKKYDRANALQNAKISSLLQHIFCASRFAHYIKVMGRDRIGSLSDPAELERELQQWIVRYVTADSEADRSIKARFPLREANVSVRATAGKPGAYECTMHLVPHYELDELAASIRLETELAPPRGT